MPTLGWDRAYRSGDLVRNDEEGLVFLGRADDQIKLGGRRIELGEVDSALLALPGVTGAAAAVRTTRSGNRVLVGYVATEPTFDARASVAHLRATMPAPLVPRLVVVDTLQTRTSGKVDRDALPWPASSVGTGAAQTLKGTAAWVHETLDRPPRSRGRRPDADFFDLGGSSLTAAQLVSRLRSRFPEVTVADVYERPTLGALADALDDMDTPPRSANRTVSPVPVKTQIGQVVFTVPLRTLDRAAVAGVDRGGGQLARGTRGAWTGCRPSSWWLVGRGLAAADQPAGSARGRRCGARLVLRGVRPGAYPRGGRTHLRIWLAERLADEAGVLNLAGCPGDASSTPGRSAPRSARHVDLHSVPPVTGMLTPRRRGARSRRRWTSPATGSTATCCTSGASRSATNARDRTRSTLCPGRGHRCVGRGRRRVGRLRRGAGRRVLVGGARGARRRGAAALGRTSFRRTGRLGPGLRRLRVAHLPTATGRRALRPAGGVALAPRHHSVTDAFWTAAATLPLATVVGLLVLALLVVAGVRLLAIGLEPGHHPVHGRLAWQAWSTLRLLDESRGWLYPLYASTVTPSGCAPWVPRSARKSRRRRCC